MVFNVRGPRDIYGTEIVYSGLCNKYLVWSNVLGSHGNQCNLKAYGLQYSYCIECLASAAEELHEILFQ